MHGRFYPPQTVGSWCAGFGALYLWMYLQTSTNCSLVYCVWCSVSLGVSGELCNSLPCLLCSSLRELALTFYDTRAIVVEVVARLVGMGTLVGTPLYARQLAALEALQIYAPMGHGLGLRPLCAQLEDRCFQVCLQFACVYIGSHTPTACTVQTKSRYIGTQHIRNSASS